MEKEKIISSISKRGLGEIYLGVVGAVRTGKSTFIKKFIENLVIPNVLSEADKMKCLDEMPQSADGKTIMTTEPKFVPSSGVKIKVNEFETNIKLVDCVGFAVDGAQGFTDEFGNPRMVKCPWKDEEVTFKEAAFIGTEKVIKDHATIGIAIMSDATFGSIPRENYVPADDLVIDKLKEYGKPYVILLNSANPFSDNTIKLARNLEDKYASKVIPININKLDEKDSMHILEEALYEFPVEKIDFKVPDWVNILPLSSEIKKEYIEKIKMSISPIKKLKDVNIITNVFAENKYITSAFVSDLDTENGVVSVTLDSGDEIYNEVLKDTLNGFENSKANILKIFTEYSSMNEEYSNIKSAMKMAKTTGYGIMYPEIKDMKLEPPEIIKQGNRYGVKLKAVASSLHLVKVDVTSTFEPVIGTELQSKELIDYIMKDYQNDPASIWKSEIFGRSLETIVGEGIKSKLSMMPDVTRIKLSDTVTKIVNKGSNTLIAIVI